MMKISSLLKKWCGPFDRVVVVTDRAQAPLAEEICAECLDVQIILYQEDFSTAVLKALGPQDLLLVILSADTFVGRGANRWFSPFAKPEGVAAKYAFVRLDISRESLCQGLATDPALVFGKIAEMGRFGQGAAVRVQNAAGTDLTCKIYPFTTCSHQIDRPGGMAFLPPSETSAEVVDGTGEGTIAVDVTVGQLYYYGELLGQFGLVDEPVVLRVEKGLITDITGGAMAGELKEKLFALSPACRRLVELGQGLSDMTPTGLIGVDESILATCHFGFGDGGSCGVHLDLVVGAPVIEEIS